MFDINPVTYKTLFSFTDYHTLKVFHKCAGMWSMFRMHRASDNSSVKLGRLHCTEEDHKLSQTELHLR